MKKSAIVLFFAAFLSISAFAQTVQEGVGHLYAERFESAKSVFQKLLAANPNNIEATYWLGQTLLAKKDIAGAKSLYEKALQSNGNAPLLMAGLGHVELLEGRKNEARSHFEAAINASKGKKGNDPAVLNAVGRANVLAYTESNKAGDLDYAITVLTEATRLAPNNADAFLNLGNAYRKKGNKGGDAITAYRQALQVNPSFAIAPYRAAMLYKTQVPGWKDPNAWSVVVENLNSAIAADPKFAPAYEELYYFNLFSKRDFSAAEKLANQYISSSDPSVENDYLKLQTLIVQKKYDEAATIGKSIIQQTNNNAKPRLYRAMAVIYLNLKDSATACNYINDFFTKATDDDILGSDYIIKAQACGRNNPELIRENIVKAVMKDSVLSRQRIILQDAKEDAKASGQRVFEAELSMLDYQLRKAKNAPTSSSELIANMVLPFYFGGAYGRADSVAQEYIKMEPDSVYGYYWSANAKAAIDTGSQQTGSFVPMYQKTLDIALKDTVRYKPMGVKAASALAIYFANIKKDYPAAIEAVNKGLMVEANNPNLLNISNLLKRAGGNRQSPPPAANTPKDTKVKTEAGKTKTKTGNK